MAKISVNFEYCTGLKQPFIVNARLGGNWNADGLAAEDWMFIAMEAFTASDGCPAFRATVQFDESQLGQTFHWGVEIATVATPNRWGIPTEVSDANSRLRQRIFVLQAAGDDAGQTERYYLTHCRRFGANKLILDDATKPAIRFAVWAPNAKEIELVFGTRESGYIFPDGRGINEELPRVTMVRDSDGIWSVDGATIQEFADFAQYDHQPYMFRITKDDGSIAYRTDLYSRCQIGSGKIDPERDPASFTEASSRYDVDGTKSCSVVIDPEKVCRPFQPLDDGGKPIFFPAETEWDSVEGFWSNELAPDRPLPTRLQDLVIYELHIDGLGLGQHERGMLEDAINLLDYLKDLGVNAVELMPFSEYEGWTSWGYGTSHYLAIEYAGGGRDQFKHFVRECHRRGIVVILDVVYNHYTHDGERAQWAYDSNAPERNIYYWYEGRPQDYPAYEEAARRNPEIPAGHGGYIDNMSTGYAPGFQDEIVRKLFISSAAQLVTEFHIDGFRVDQTTSIHNYAVLHANGQAANNARIFGAKFLREWTRTLRLIKPEVFLIAEDHSGWDALTQSSENGGLGFDATWYADYYHHLIGDANNDDKKAHLLKFAGYGNDSSLHMTWFAGALQASTQRRIVYHESHDEAGNSHYQEGDHDVYSARTLVVAVNGAPLIGDTRRFAEARARVVAGVTLLSPGVPMFFMGEEVGATEPYRFNDFLQHREDFQALRQGAGAHLFRFYQDVIALRLSRVGLRSSNLDIVYVHDANRILAFRHWERTEEYLIVVSLNNKSFSNGYQMRNMQLTEGEWREILNSDEADYGGWDTTNPTPVRSSGGTFGPRIPANSVLVFQRQ